MKTHENPSMGDIRFWLFGTSVIDHLFELYGFEGIFTLITVRTHVLNNKYDQKKKQ